MTTLRALVGAYSMVAFVGFIISVPLAWTIVIGIAATSPEKIQGQRDQQNVTYEGIKYKIASKWK